MAIRTDSNYYINGDCALSLTGENANKWAVLVNHDYDTLTNVDSYLDSSGWGSSATLTNVNSTNSIFWLKALSSPEEVPTISGGTMFTVNGVVAASVTANS